MKTSQGRVPAWVAVQGAAQPLGAQTAAAPAPNLPTAAPVGAVIVTDPPGPVGGVPAARRYGQALLQRGRIGLLQVQPSRALQ